MLLLFALMLVWDYPAEELSTDLTFKVYSHTNVAVPVSQWPVIAHLVGTNTSFEIPEWLGPERYFQVTASNAFGESDFASTTK